MALARFDLRSIQQVEAHAEECCDTGRGIRKKVNNPLHQDAAVHGDRSRRGRGGQSRPHVLPSLD